MSEQCKKDVQRTKSAQAKAQKAKALQALFKLGFKHKEATYGADS